MSPAPGPEPEPPGLQPERTTLAWQRTGLAAATVSLVSGFTALRIGLPLLAVPAVGVTMMALLVVTRRLPRAGTGRPAHAAWRAVVLVALVVVAVAGLGGSLGAAQLLRLLG